MMSLHIDRQNEVALVDQIVHGVCRQIESRVLMPGARLPSIRTFAKKYKVSRFTVVEAYDRLVALGFLQSRRGAGFFAANRVNGHGSREGAAPAEHMVDVAWLFRRYLDEHDGRILAGGPWLPDDWMDETGLRHNLRVLTRMKGSHLLGYGNPKGYLPLREQLQLKLAALDVAATPEQIVLTHGVSQALDLVMRFVLKPGDSVMVDDPGYYNFFANLRVYGARLHGVPRNADGPDVAALVRIAETHRPKLYFTQSAMQNPTSGDMSPSVAFRVLQAAEKYDFLVVEDDVFCDLQPAPTQRLATLDQLNRVIYISSFSKTLSGSLRVGYLACRRDIAEGVTDMKMMSCITTSQFGERLVYQMLVEGHFRKFVERLRGRLESARNRTLETMERLGMEVFVEPSAGMFLWARFPQVEDAAELSNRAFQKGIILAPGAVFRPNLERSAWMRFNVSVFENPALQEFLRHAN
ncbi:MAG TPA: PLP-dependent aminotransferase family protein [Burkholderiales bacterium]|nr:PLP-dependent aminotransferase family protein [Burkholderiales bacterium]